MWSNLTIAWGWSNIDTSKLWIYYNWGNILVTDGTTMYIIADKNVGASVAWTGANSYWCHFQWGNKHCFPSQWTVTVSTTPIDASSYEPSQYSNDKFITQNPWDTSKNTNLRWHITNTNEARRGPCQIDIMYLAQW